MSAPCDWRNCATSSWRWRMASSRGSMLKPSRASKLAPPSSTSTRTCAAVEEGEQAGWLVDMLASSRACFAELTCVSACGAALLVGPIFTWVPKWSDAVNEKANLENMQASYRFEAAVGSSNVQRSALVIVGGIDVDAGLNVVPDEVNLALGCGSAQLRGTLDLIKAQPAYHEISMSFQYAPKMPYRKLCAGPEARSWHLHNPSAHACNLE